MRLAVMKTIAEREHGSLLFHFAGSAIQAIGSIEGEAWMELLKIARPTALATMTHQLPPGFSIVTGPTSTSFWPGLTASGP